MACLGPQSKLGTEPVWNLGVLTPRHTRACEPGLHTSLLPKVKPCHIKVRGSRHSHDQPCPAVEIFQASGKLNSLLVEVVKAAKCPPHPSEAASLESTPHQFSCLLLPIRRVRRLDLRPCFPSSTHLKCQEHSYVWGEASASLSFHICDSGSMPGWLDSRDPHGETSAERAVEANQPLSEPFVPAYAAAGDLRASQGLSFPLSKRSPCEREPPTSKAGPQRGPDIVGNNVACLPDRLSAFFSSPRKRAPAGSR